MPLGPPSRKSPPLGVLPMALALIVAAFLGAAIGLVYQASGLGDADEEAEAASTEQASD